MYNKKDGNKKIRKQKKTKIYGSELPVQGGSSKIIHSLSSEHAFGASHVTGTHTPLELRSKPVPHGHGRKLHFGSLLSRDTFEPTFVKTQNFPFINK